MSAEDFSVNSIEWLKDVKFDEIVFGSPGKMFVYSVLLFLWVYIVSWIYKDAEVKYYDDSRMKYVWLIVGIVTAPIAWFVYLILRPAKDLDEVYLQKIEERYIEFESRGLGYCAACAAQVDPGFVHCSGCGKKIRERCGKCESLVETTFGFCPSCGTKTTFKKRQAIFGMNESDKLEGVLAKKVENGAAMKANVFDSLGKYFSKIFGSAGAFLTTPRKRKKNNKRSKMVETTAKKKGNRSIAKIPPSGSESKEAKKGGSKYGKVRESAKKQEK